MANLIIENGECVAVLSDRCPVPFGAESEPFPEGDFIAIYGDKSERIGGPGVDPRVLMSDTEEREKWDKRRAEYEANEKAHWDKMASRYKAERAAKKAARLDG